jgi:hypothetical protein
MEVGGRRSLADCGHRLRRQGSKSACRSPIEGFERSLSRSAQRDITGPHWQLSPSLPPAGAGPCSCTCTGTGTGSSMFRAVHVERVPYWYALGHILLVAYPTVGYRHVHCVPNLLPGGRYNNNAALLSGCCCFSLSSQTNSPGHLDQKGPEGTSRRLSLSIRRNILRSIDSFHHVHNRSNLD